MTLWEGCLKLRCKINKMEKIKYIFTIIISIPFIIAFWGIQLFIMILNWIKEKSKGKKNRTS